MSKQPVDYEDAKDTAGDSSRSSSNLRMKEKSDKDNNR